MGKIIYLMGKSCTGKDTIYKRLRQNQELGLKEIVPYTTRPIRIKEIDGVEYHFTEEDEFHRLEAEGKIIEARAYNTYHGLWRYFTVDDGQINLKENNYIYIGTLESYNNTKKYFGAKAMVPVLIELGDGARIQRAIDREKKQKEPKYEEMCRRFLADSEDFSKEKIVEAEISRCFLNENLEFCLSEIESYIKEQIQ